MMRPMSTERRGLLLMFASSFLFACMGLCVKLASNGLPVPEVTFFRAAGAAVFTYGLMRLARIPFRPRGWRLLVLRGVLGWSAMMSYFIALSGMDLADGVLLTNTSPFFTCLLAAAVLGETLSRRSLACLALGIAGVAFVVGPKGGFWNVYALGALASAMLSSSAYIALKRASADNSAWTIALTFALVAAGLTLPWMALDVRTPTPAGWGLLLAVALTGTIAQICMTYGYSLARASAASIVSLSTPLFAALLGLLALGALPTPATCMGGVMILAAGALLLARPRSVARPDLRAENRPDAVAAEPGA